MTKEDSHKVDDCVQYYCVYWYPTIFHKQRKSKTHQIPEKFIDDQSPLYSLSISVNENENNGDLTFNIWFYDGKVSEENKQRTAVKEIEVKYTACHTLMHDCFVIYSYQREKFVDDVKNVLGYFYNKAIHHNETDSAVEVLYKKANEFVDRIFLNFYHQAKGLYHEHEVQKESDGRLHAYFYNEKENSYVIQEPNIDLRNHEAIICYLDQYEQLFSTYAQQVSTLYRQFKEHVDSFSEVVPPERLHESSRNDLVESLLKLRFEKYLQDKIDEPLVDDDSNGPLSEEDIKRLKDEDTAKEDKDKQWLKDEKSKIVRIVNNEEIVSEIRQRYNYSTILLVNELNTLLKLCGDALTEYNYCKTLLESRYNSDYGYGILFDSCEEIQTSIKNEQSDKAEKQLKTTHRKKAFNIDNSARYIEEVRHKCDVWENQLLQDTVIRINHLSDLNQTLLHDIQALSETNTNLINQTKQTSDHNTELLNQAKKSDRRAMIVAIFFGIVGVASLIASIISICRCI